MEGLCSGVNSNSISSIIYLYQIQWMGYTGCCTGRDPTKIPTRDTVLLHAVSEANSRGGKKPKGRLLRGSKDNFARGCSFHRFSPQHFWWCVATIHLKSRRESSQCKSVFLFLLKQWTDKYNECPSVLTPCLCAKKKRGAAGSWEKVYVTNIKIVSGLDRCCSFEIVADTLTWSKGLEV